MSSSKRIQDLRHQAFKAQGGRCYYCGVSMWLKEPIELPGVPLAAAGRLRCTAEHLVAQCDAGRDTRVNIAAACAHCNLTRHKRKRPPAPAAYRQEVRRRVERGAWHLPWVFKLGLVPQRQPMP